MSRRSRWVKRIAVWMISIVLIAGAGLAYTWRRMSQEDLRHASFCSCCTSIKGLLAAYGTALEESLLSNDITKLERFYAAEYVSSHRGQFQFNSANDLGAVKLTHFVATGDKPATRADV
ncbi:MAG: hypothetical protein ABL921_01625, partial [Pirellula sp.]